MKNFAVIGLGKFGFYVAKTLFEEGHEVVAIDNDKKRVQLVDPYCTEAICMDAIDKERLKALGLEKMNGVLVSTGDNISISILITLHLKEIGAQKILVKALDEDHNKILNKIGATEVIHPERAMAVKVARGMSTPNILDFIPLTEDYNLLQIHPPQVFIGKSLKELGLRVKYNVQVIAIKEIASENFILVPSAEFVIKDNDTLIMLGKTNDIKRIKALR